MTPDSTHPTPQELARHAARQLAATDVLRVSDHLAGCEACREAFNRARASLPAPERGLPTFAELDGAMSGTLSPAERANFAARLEGSAAAREALADLTAFRDELASLPVKFHGPQTPAGNRIVRPPSWHWHRASAWTAGLAALLVALAVWWGTFARHGSELLRDGQGRAVDLTGLPMDLRKSVETALRSGRLPPPASTSELTGPRGELAGTDNAPTMTVATPVGTVVRETRPTFRWTARADAAGYRVSIVPVDGGAVVSSPPLSAPATTWTPPDALGRGTAYSWQVAAVRDGRTIERAPRPPASEARFEVLDAGNDAELSRVETQAAGNPLILGVAYWRAGLVDSARDQFHRLASAHVQSSVARQLELDATRGKEADHLAP